VRYSPRISEAVYNWLAKAIEEQSEEEEEGQEDVLYSQQSLDMENEYDSYSCSKSGALGSEISKTYRGIAS